MILLKEHFSKNKLRYLAYMPLIVFTIIILIILSSEFTSTLKNLHVQKNLIPDIDLPIGIDTNSNLINNYSEDQIKYIKQYAMHQYTKSTGNIFFIFILCYFIHLFLIIPNLYETFMEYKKHTSGAKEIFAHGWYLLIIIIALPLSFSVIPEFSTDYKVYTPELTSRIVLAILSNIIVILMTAELSTLYFSLDREYLISNYTELIERIFKDSRLKHLLVAIVLDIMVFFFISRLPSLKQRLYFEDITVYLFITTAFYSLLSSYASIFSLALHERIQRLDDKKKIEVN